MVVCFGNELGNVFFDFGMKEGVGVVGNSLVLTIVALPVTGLLIVFGILQLASEHGTLAEFDLLNMRAEMYGQRNQYEE